MKTFWVWAGDQHYPERGLRDLQYTCKTLEEAKVWAAKLSDKHDWVEIEDISELL